MNKPRLGEGTLDFYVDNVELLCCALAETQKSVESGSNADPAASGSGGPRKRARIEPPTGKDLLISQSFTVLLVLFQVGFKFRCRLYAKKNSCILFRI